MSKTVNEYNTEMSATAKLGPNASGSSKLALISDAPMKKIQYPGDDKIDIDSFIKMNAAL